MSGNQKAVELEQTDVKQAVDLILTLEEGDGVIVNEYILIYRKRRGKGVFIFARDYRRGYWAEAPLAPNELATLLALLLAPPQRWPETLARERYNTLVVNGYVRIEKGVKDGVLLVAVSDYRKNYNATAIYFASDREKFAARLQRSEQDKKLEEQLKLLLAELVKLETALSEELLCEEDWPVGQRIKCPRCGREGKAGISFFKAKGHEYVYLVVNHSDGRKCVIARADDNIEGIAASSEEVVPGKGGEKE